MKFSFYFFFIYFSPHQATIYKKKLFCTEVLIVMTAELWLHRGGMSVVGSEVFVQTLSWDILSCFSITANLLLFTIVNSCFSQWHSLFCVHECGGLLSFTWLLDYLSCTPVHFRPTEQIGQGKSTRHQSLTIALL